MGSFHIAGTVRSAGAVLSSVVAVCGLLAAPSQATADGNQLVSHWKLNQLAGTLTIDSVTHRLGHLHNGAMFVPGRLGHAVALDGVDDFVSGPTDLQPDAAFTVTAWINLAELPQMGDDGTPGISTAVSIDGERTSKFRLGAVVDDDNSISGRWFFEMPESDTDGAFALKSAVSASHPPLNTWVFLAGTYDPSISGPQLLIYVDGTRKGDGTVDTPWPAPGHLRIGRGKINGAPSQYWHGMVDDVRLYRTALDSDAIAALYQSFPPPTG